MSLDLIELPRIKVSPEVHALISAEAEISGEEINAIVREWLHDRGQKELNKLRIANKHLNARGLPCINVEDRR